MTGRRPVVLCVVDRPGWAHDRKTDAPVVATEFVGTSISSAGDGMNEPKGLAELMAHNAGLKYHNRERGYVRCAVKPGEWKTDYVTMTKVTEANLPPQIRASFVVEAGQAGVKRA